MTRSLFVPGIHDPDPLLGPLPEAYSREAPQRGTLTEITYTIADGSAKQAFVYTPYGYDPSSRYDVFYMMHGGGGNHHTCLADPDGIFRRMLDHSILEKRIRPLIVVTPTFYPAGNTDTTPEHSGELILNVPEEMLTFLMPAVESRFSTFSLAADRESFRQSRSHRAFGGFSMGSVATWQMLLHCADCFSLFLPMSGDCWIHGRLGGGTDPEGTAEAIAEALLSQNAPPCTIFSLTGTEDIAYPNLKPQIMAMVKRGDVFAARPGAPGHPLRFSVCKGAYHCYEAIWEDLYYAMPLLWPPCD